MSSHKNHRTISFLVPYPIGISPGQRFRFEQYLEVLTYKGYSISILPFFKKPKLNQTKNPFVILKIFSGFVNRFRHLFTVAKSDFVFIFRECCPVGLPIFEWICCKILRKKIIYDFDDAIWASDVANESRFQSFLRWRRKVQTICKWSYKVSCGNEYLRQFALKFNTSVLLNPTTIDTENVHNPTLHVSEKNQHQFIIGWTGSHSTLKYLYRLESVLKKIQDKYPHVFLLVIADKQPALNLPNILFEPWSVNTEITSLLKSDIGIMPLPNDEWSKGKCGFKALQYLSLGIPAVVSPVGVNTTIVDHHINGFIADSDEEWIKCIEMLINNPSLREEMGVNGRRKVIEHYSVESNTSNFLSLFE